MNSIPSPIDKTSPTSFVTHLFTEQIVREYKKQGYDVTRFFQGLDQIEIRECIKTGYRFYYPFTVFGDEQFYIDIQNQAHEYYPEGKWEHKQALSLISPNSRVLEVGCATGHFMQLLHKKNCKAVGIELNNQAVNTAKKNGLEVYNEMLSDHAEKNEGKYDYVCSFQVLEHISDVNDYFISALKCLKPNGKMIIGVPNSNPYLYKSDIYHAFNVPPHHAGLWNKQTFEKTAAAFNLTPSVIKIEKLKEYKVWYLMQMNDLLKRKKIVGQLLSFVPRPVYKTAIKLFSPFIEGRNILVMLSKSKNA